MIRFFFQDRKYVKMDCETLKKVKEKIKSYKTRFDTEFETIVNEIVQEDLDNAELTKVAEWLRQSIEYNAFAGKKSRGMTVIGTVVFLRHGNPVEDEIKKAMVLGSCIEILQALFLIADDIMDRSELRRGQPCWYKKCGLIAINDTFLLEQCIYKLLDEHFKHESYVLELYKLFHRVTYLTASGQCLDMFASEPPEELFSLDLFTEEKYKSISKYKTVYPFFYLPVCLGMHIVKVLDQHMYKDVERISMKLGEYFQIQDDYLDCYGNPDIMGKIGRDIEDGKCSWLVVQALKKVTRDERRVLDENYGKDDQEKVQIVKELYEKLELKALFEECEKQNYLIISDMIKHHPMGFPRELFMFLLNKIYKRNK